MKILKIDPEIYEGQFSFPSLLELNFWSWKDFWVSHSWERDILVTGTELYRSAYIKDSLKIIKSKGGEKWLDSLGYA